MAVEHVIPITNGKGSKELSNGTYSVTASVLGYDDSTINPAEQEITEGVNSYSFTIGATGTLILHVTDEGTDIGIPIEGATFYRCDADGNTYGEIITSDAEGNAVFNSVPFSAEEGAPIVYFKQTASDGEHTFSDALQNTTLDSDTKTVEIANPMAPEREINLTDANYDGLPIADGSLTLSA